MIIDHEQELREREIMAMFIERRWDEVNWSESDIRRHSARVLIDGPLYMLPGWHTIVHRTKAI